VIDALGRQLCRVSPTVLVAALLTATLAAAVQSPSPRTIRILFIGNSLTRANNLPSMVEALARAQGHTIETFALVVNNFSLEDHWNQGQAQGAISKGGWTFVVLQQGPSSLPESRVLLRDYAKRFASEAKNAGAGTALYMVWPAKAREGDFDAVSESYALAAKDADGVLLPAGDAWRDAWRHDPSLELYAEDGFHPSRFGSYLAALTIWRGLSGQTVIGLPGVDGVNPETTRVLQNAAENVFVSVPRRQEFFALR
jgi:hypothetical protein